MTMTPTQREQRLRATVADSAHLLREVHDLEFHARAVQAEAIRRLRRPLPAFADQPTHPLPSNYALHVENKYPAR